MNTCNLIIFPFIFFFLNTSPHLTISSTNEINYISLHRTIFIKQNWHTAIVFSKSEFDSTLFREYNSFKTANLIDIGWGDKEFYQYPGFDSGLAFNALFYPTPSTLRVESINLTEEEYFSLSEIVIEVYVTDSQLLDIFSYINNTFYLNENGTTTILSQQANGKIIFYKAVGSYSLLNTCNTWLAKGLNKAGLNIENNIILTEQLFNELSRIGRVLKTNYTAD